jgi:hypothetical protein
VTHSELRLWQMPLAYSCRSSALRLQLLLLAVLVVVATMVRCSHDSVVGIVPAGS